MSYAVGASKKKKAATFNDGDVSANPLLGVNLNKH